MMNVLDLFSGIGGFSLGLEQTEGFRTIAFCEIDPYCRRVLAKHWPDVPILGDVRAVTAQALANAIGLRQLQPQGRECDKRGWSSHSGVDVICGGFPCQDISVAGKGAGLAGSRSGLWKEYARIIGELRPRFIIVENVAALLSRGLGDVLGDLATLGYDAEWHCIPASAVGAPHRRDRIWIVAYAQRDVIRQQSGRRDGTCGAGAPELRDYGAAESLAFANGPRLEECVENWAALRQFGLCGGTGSYQEQSVLADAASERLERSKLLRIKYDLSSLIGNNSWWHIEPHVGRVAHGVPARVDRLKALGNAVVPQIPEIIGRAILAAAAL